MNRLRAISDCDASRSDGGARTHRKTDCIGLIALVLLLAVNLFVTCDNTTNSQSPGTDPAVPLDIADVWFFFGDSETDGRAYDEPTAVSQAVAFENIWDGSFGSPYTSVIFGEGGGITLKESYENYLATAGTDDATWINIQESGRHGQAGRGQEDPQDFGDTFEQFVRHIDANAPDAVITYETAFSFEPHIAERNWTAFNTELRERVTLLAAEGIVVHLAEVALHIEELIAQLDRYDVIQSDDAHYTGLGNLTVALSIYRALGYDVTALDLSGIADDDVSPQHKAAAQAVIAGQ